MRDNSLKDLFCHNFPGRIKKNLWYKFLLLVLSQWRRLFYRLIASRNDEDGERLRRIENKMFQELIRREVEDETGSWSGSIDQN